MIGLGKIPGGGSQMRAGGAPFVQSAAKWSGGGGGGMHHGHHGGGHFRGRGGFWPSYAYSEPYYVVQPQPIVVQQPVQQNGNTTLLLVALGALTVGALVVGLTR